LTVQVRYVSLTKSKGVHCEVESEGRWRQSFDTRATNIIWHIRWDELQHKTKSQSYMDNRAVNDAGTWNEGYSPYQGRSH